MKLRNIIRGKSKIKEGREAEVRYGHALHLSFTSKLLLVNSLKIIWCLWMVDQIFKIWELKPGIRH